MDDATLIDGLSPDDAFEILSNSRRRAMIHYLHDCNGQANLSELADHIAAWEYGVDEEEISSDQRRRVYISLYQTHLPKLAEYGVVEYDEEEKSVALTERVAAVDRFLYIDDRDSSRWWIAYVGLAGVATALLVGTWIDGGVSLWSRELLALLIAGGFVLLSAVHYAATRFRRRHRQLHREW